MQILHKLYKGSRLWCCANKEKKLETVGRKKTSDTDGVKREEPYDPSKVVGDKLELHLDDFRSDNTFGKVDR